MSASALIRKSSLSFAIRISGALAGFLFNVVVTRQLGLESSGHFFLSLTMITVLATFSRMGLGSTVTRYVAASIAANDWSAVHRIYRVSIVSVSIAAFAASSVAYLCTDLIAEVMSKGELRTVLPVLTFIVFPMALAMQHSHLFQGRKSMLGFQFCQQLGPSVIFLALLPLAIAFTQPKNLTELLPWTLVLSHYLVVGMALLAWHLTTKDVHGETAESHFPIRQLFATAMPMWAISLLELVERSLGQLVLGVWGTSEDIALFSVSLRLAILVSFVQVSLNSIAFPTFAGLYRENRIPELKRTAVLSARLATIVCTPVLVFFFLCPDIVLRLFGSGFEDGRWALRVMALGQFVNVATGSVAGLLSMTGNERMLLIGSIGSALLMAVLLALLIPPLGATGAAIAQAVAVSGRMIFLLFCVRRVFGFSPLGL